MKSPYLETEESVKKYAAENNLDSTLCLWGKDSLSAGKLLTLAGNHAQILVFNKDGFLNEYVEKTGCAGPVENYLRNICTNQPISIDSTVRRDDVLSLLTPVYDGVVIPDVIENDITVFIFWPIWFGKKNKFAFSWKDVLAKDAGNCKIKTFLVNNDFRAEHYGYNKRVKIKTDIGSGLSK